MTTTTRGRVSTVAGGLALGGMMAALCLSSHEDDGGSSFSDLMFSNLRSNVEFAPPAEAGHRRLEVIADVNDPRSVEVKELGKAESFLDQALAQDVALTGEMLSNVVDQSTLPPPEVLPNAHPSFESLLEKYVLDEERSRYLINVGAQDGKTHDPTYDLLYTQGYEGILFEGFERQKKALYKNLAALPHPERVTVSWGYTSPNIIIQQLVEGRARKDPDVLKLDIDSFDADLMQTILEHGYDPKIVMVEFNPDVPPPLSWMQLYSDHPHNVKKGRMGNYGASASAWYEIMTERFGYGLVGMELTNEEDKCLRCEHNMWFVSREFLNRRGYRAMTHEEMVRLFWGTHGQNKMKCIHAQHPCLLNPPKELTKSIPNYKELDKKDQFERNAEISLLISDGDISCKTWKAYQSSIVENYLGQMEAGCKCFGCKKGDPCKMEWGVRTKNSDVCAA